MKKLLDSVTGVEIGVIAGLDADGSLRVEMPDGSSVKASPLWTGADVAWNECVGLRAVVASATGQSTTSFLIGLLDRPRAATAPSAGRVERVQHVRASDELILECGKSKVSLRADGRVVILGGYLLSRSSGVNKIKGGSVEIN